MGAGDPKIHGGFSITRGKAAIACLAFFGAILYLYAPALNGRFVFDDLSLPFLQASRDGPLLNWISGVRPVLMFTYWLNYRVSGETSSGYHLLNLGIHFANTGLVFLVLSWVLTNAGWPRKRAVLASLAGSLVFAIHPLQTESVSYLSAVRRVWLHCSCCLHMWCFCTAGTAPSPGRSQGWCCCSSVLP